MAKCNQLTSLPFKGLKKSISHCLLRSKRLLKQFTDETSMSSWHRWFHPYRPYRHSSIATSCMVQTRFMIVAPFAANVAENWSLVRGKYREGIRSGHWGYRPGSDLSRSFKIQHQDPCILIQPKITMSVPAVSFVIWIIHSFIIRSWALSSDGDARIFYSGVIA